MCPAEAHAEVELTALPEGPDLPPAHQSRRWISRPFSFLRELQAAHGDLFTLNLQYQNPWVMVGDPELIKQVFTAPGDVLQSGAANAYWIPVLGHNSVITLDGAAHLRHRKLLLPAFHGARIERYREIMRAATLRELEHWPKGEPVAATPRISELALEVILRAVFGVQDRGNLDPLHDAVTKLVATMSRAKLALLGRAERLGEARFAEFRRALEHLHSQVLAEIVRHRADPNLGARDDVMSLLLEARFEDGAKMTNDELRDELTGLLLAGHETTAMSLSWTLERLVRNPDALARASADAEEGDGTYIEATIREALRCRPAFAIVARLVRKPFELDGYEIPPGVTIMPSPVLVHHRTDIYPDPDAFRPERFLEHAPGTYTWIPFGGGPRRCLGANFAVYEMQTVLATLLVRTRPRASDPEPEEPKRRLITFGPAKGAELILK